MKTSWRRLEDVFCLRLQKTSSRRLQDVLIKTNTFGLVIIIQDVDDDTHSMEITVHWVLMWLFSYQTSVTWHLVPSIMTSSLYLIRKFYRMVSNLVPLRIKYELHLPIVVAKKCGPSLSITCCHLSIVNSRLIFCFYCFMLTVWSLSIVNLLLWIVNCLLFSKYYPLI